MTDLIKPVDEVSVIRLRHKRYAKFGNDYLCVFSVQETDCLLTKIKALEAELEQALKGTP